MAQGEQRHQGKRLQQGSLKAPQGGPQCLGCRRLQTVSDAGEGHQQGPGQLPGIQGQPKRLKNPLVPAGSGVAVSRQEEQMFESGHRKD